MLRIDSKLLVIEYNKDYNRNSNLVWAFLQKYKTRVHTVSQPITLAEKIDIILKFFTDKKITTILYLWPCNTSLILLFGAKLFKKTIISDCFVSYYDSAVNDRKTCKKYSIFAIKQFILDYLNVKAGNILFFDTPSHKEFFANTFGIPPKKIIKIVPVSVDIDYINKIQPTAAVHIFSNTKVNILWYGSYIPLQGVEYIIEAASLLSASTDIQFILVGASKEKLKTKINSNIIEASNINFLERVPYNILLEYIKRSDFCLGIFGDTDKAKRVIPNKVLDCMACGKAVITGSNNDMRKYFTDHEDIVYCEMANANDLANKITWLINNPEALSAIQINASKKITKYFDKKILLDII